MLNADKIDGVGQTIKGKWDQQEEEEFFDKTRITGLLTGTLGRRAHEHHLLKRLGFLQNTQPGNGQNSSNPTMTSLEPSLVIPPPIRSDGEDLNHPFTCPRLQSQKFPINSMPGLISLDVSTERSELPIDHRELLSGQPTHSALPVRVSSPRSRQIEPEKKF